MKKLALLFIVPLAVSCASYETVTIVDATPVYASRDTDKKPIATIPANTEVMMAGKSKFKKVKYKDQKGFVLNPNHATHTVVKKTVPPKK
ncbi:MAG: hypothetical protein ACO1N9_13730 [Flavobacterium sp.]